MSGAGCTLVRINAGNIQTDMWLGLDDKNVDTKIKQLMSSTARAETGQSGAHASDIMVERTTWLFWGDDGKTHEFDIFADENGKAKSLPPNHQVNAMIHAARFTTKRFDTVRRARNQEMKDAYGSNFFVGDVYIKVPSGKDLDLFICGNNPIDFIIKERTPSNKMKQEYGIEVANNMLNPRMRKNHPYEYSGTLDQYRQMLNNLNWVFIDYNICPNNCDDNSYKALLRSWGYGTEKKKDGNNA